MKNSSANTKKVRFLRQNDKIRGTDFVTGCGDMKLTKEQWKECALNEYNDGTNIGGFIEASDLRRENIGRKVGKTNWANKIWIIARVY